MFINHDRTNKHPPQGCCVIRYITYLKNIDYYCLKEFIKYLNKLKKIYIQKFIRNKKANENTRLRIKSP